MKIFLDSFYFITTKPSLFRKAFSFQTKFVLLQPTFICQMSQHNKVAFYPFSCMLNFSETATIARSFQQEGFERVDFQEKADIYVINTCSVTENADKQFKQSLKKALKVNEK